jgi:tRNA/tmRNA/rRNA uracil-C5-methylase (TrmA/RlmC/RlmD family)
VVFVRLGLPGETVLARVDDDSHSGYWFATCVQVIEASPHRVEPPCPVADTCGGCDFQHAALSYQRELKAQCVADQLSKVGCSPSEPIVARPLRKDETGLGWRTRMDYTCRDSQVGLTGTRSHRMVPLPSDGCLIAHPDGRDAVKALTRGGRRGSSAWRVVVSSESEVRVADVHDKAAIREPVHEWVGRRQFAVQTGGFWQVHPDAAGTFTDVVLDYLRPKPGERAVDLYCGVGLFAAALADAGCDVTGIEGDKGAVSLARRNVPEAKFFAADLPTKVPLAALSTDADLVVLDPPRAGAKGMVGAIAGVHPRAIAYVSCDPATLARDLAEFATLGYHVDSLCVFDAFPMTHHVETLVKLIPNAG